MAEIFLIECDGKINGRRCTWFAERDCDDMGFSQTVHDILTGQVENVARVYRADTEAKTFQDASEDVALEMTARIRDEGRDMPSGSIMDFLENALGCETVAKFERAMEAA